MSMTLKTEAYWSKLSVTVKFWEIAIKGTVFKGVYFYGKIVFTTKYLIK